MKRGEGHSYAAKVVKAAERVRYALPWFAFAEWLRIKRLEEVAKKDQGGL